MACDCKDEEEQKMVKFLFGLSTPIANHVELQQYYSFSFDELCSLASNVERQQKEVKGKSIRRCSGKRATHTIVTPKQ